MEYQLKLSTLTLSTVYDNISDDLIEIVLSNKDPSFRSDLSRDWYIIMYENNIDYPDPKWYGFHAARIATIIEAINSGVMTKVEVLIENDDSQRSITDGNHRVRALRYMYKKNMISANFLIDVTEWL